MVTYLSVPGRLILAEVMGESRLSVPDLLRVLPVGQHTAADKMRGEGIAEKGKLVLIRLPGVCGLGQRHAFGVIRVSTSTCIAAGTAGRNRRDDGKYNAQQCQRGTRIAQDAADGIKHFIGMCIHEATSDNSIKSIGGKPPEYP